MLLELPYVVRKKIWEHTQRDYNKAQYGKVLREMYEGPPGGSGVGPFCTMFTPGQLTTWAHYHSDNGAGGMIFRNLSHSVRFIYGLRPYRECTEGQADLYRTMTSAWRFIEEEEEESDDEGESDEE